MEILRRGLEAWNSGDLETWLGYWAEDGEWFPVLTGGGAGRGYHGRDQIQESWADVRSAWDEVRLEASEIRELGDGRYLIAGRLVGRGRGLELDQEFAWVLQLRDGEVVRGQGYLSPAEALLDAAPRE